VAADFAPAVSAGFAAPAAFVHDRHIALLLSALT